MVKIQKIPQHPADKETNNNTVPDVAISDFINIITQEMTHYQTPVVDLIAVQTNDPFKILVATILSARTKDETTAKAAKRLFKKASNLQELAALNRDDLEKLIHPVGFFRNKAGYLQKLPQVLKKKFANIIPQTVEELCQLPGVGRKTANLVVAVAFNKPAICVDTHVHRITNIWGYVETKTPLETETALRAKLPAQFWRQINSTLVAFGQSICLPRRPRCHACPINKNCQKNGVTPAKNPAARQIKTPSDRLKLVSWNVNGLRAIEKKGFIEIVNELEADIIALQEIKGMPEQFSDAVKNIAGFRSYFFPAQRKGYAGVAIYSRLEPIKVRYGMGIDDHDTEGRVLTLEFDDFSLVNAYFPNSQHGLARLDYKIRFNNDLLAYCNDLAAKKSVLLCGDYNVAHKEIDLANPRQNEKNPGFTMEERQWMDSFLKAGYTDTFRMFNQNPNQYSWWSYRFNARARNIGWRIDYFCVDTKSKARVKNAEIKDEIMGSDHCPVLVEWR